MSSPVAPFDDRLAGMPAWRVVALAAGIVLATLLAVVLVVVVATLTAPVSPLSGRVHQAAVGLPVVLGFYGAIRRWFFRVPAAWFRVGRPSRRVVAWAALGLAFPATVLAGQLWLLGATLTGGLPGFEAVPSALAASLVAGLLAGVLEELPLRGALLRVVESRWGPRLAVLTSAIVFAALHQGHVHGPLGLAFVLSSMVAAGLFLGVVVVRTRSVWNAVALHAGWNTVFGGQVVARASAGGSLDPALFQFRVPASDTLMTGGEAGLGAAPVTTGCLLLATAAVLRAPPHWLATDPGGSRGQPRGEP